MKSITDIQPWISLLALGKSMVGKTSVIHYFHTQSPLFEPTQNLGFDLVISQAMINPRKYIQVQFFDNAGYDSLKNVRATQFRYVQGILIVCDVTEQESIEAVPEYIKMVHDFLPKELPIVVLVNKIDIGIQAQCMSRILQLRKSYPLRIHAVSAITGEGINDAIQDLVQQAWEYKLNLTPVKSFRISKNPKGQSKKNKKHIFSRSPCCP